jgi:hypothetical protein
MIFTGVEKAEAEKAPLRATTALFALPAIRKASSGFEVVIERPYSFVPGDHFLSIVLARSTGERLGLNRQLVTWMHNRQDGGYSSGHYFNETHPEEAIEDFETRGRLRSK